jgi:hypothetical protein
MIDDSDSPLLSLAVVAWTGWGRHAWPLRDDQAILDEFGPRASELLAAVKSLKDDFYASDARLTARDLIEMGDKAETAFRERHPEISDDAVQALSWCYTFDYK